MWLRDWGAEDEVVSSNSSGKGIFGRLKREFLEVEILKAFLASSRMFSLLLPDPGVLGSRGSLLIRRQGTHWLDPSMKTHQTDHWPKRRYKTRYLLLL